MALAAQWEAPAVASGGVRPCLLGGCGLCKGCMMLLVWRVGWVCGCGGSRSLSVTLGESSVGSSTAAAANLWLQPVVVQRGHCNPMYCTVYISTGKVAPGLVPPPPAPPPAPSLYPFTSSFMKFLPLNCKFGLIFKGALCCQAFKGREEARAKTSNPLTAQLPEKMFFKTKSETLVFEIQSRD